MLARLVPVHTHTYTYTVAMEINLICGGTTHTVILQTTCVQNKRTCAVFCLGSLGIRGFPFSGGRFNILSLSPRQRV